MFFGKWKKQKTQPNAASGKNTDGKAGKPQGKEKTGVSRTAPDAEQNLEIRTAAEQEVAVPLDHPLMVLAHALPAMAHARTENDFYEGSERPACFDEFKGIAESRYAAARDMPDKPLDARAEIWLSPDRMQAWIAVYPPASGGADILPEVIDQAVEQRKLKEGLRETALKKAKTPGGYLQLLCIAQGKPEVNGQDGRVESRVPELDARLKEDTRGKINFADLNWLVNVDKGQQLAEIFPATEGVDGVDVLGKVVRGKNGKPAPKVNGKNTSYTEDGRFLIADGAGQLINNGGKYLVNEVLTIRGDVDYSTGNIKSNNTVVIEGNVKPNFTVESTQDVIINGTVEWATIIAGHDINVNGGVTAGPDDYLQAGNDIHCRFMENGRASCGGNAYFENLVLCELRAEGSVYVTSGRGTVVAGSVTAMGDIRVTTIGNRSYRATEVRVGVTPKFRERLDRCTNDLKTTRETIKQGKANISKLVGQAGNPKADAALSSQKSLLNMATMKLEKLEAQYEKLSEMVRLTKRRRIYADLAHPNVTITIGEDSTVLRHEAHYAAFVLKNHEIEMLSQ